MANICIKGWRVEVVCDLYNAGITEDGEEFHAEAYYIQAVRKDGHTLSHFKTWEGCERVEIEGGHNEPDGFFFADVRKEVLEEANALLSLIEDAGCIDDDHWGVSEPSYGSEAYCKKYGF